MSTKRKVPGSPPPYPDAPPPAAGPRWPADAGQVLELSMVAPDKVVVDTPAARRRRFSASVVAGAPRPGGGGAARFAQLSDDMMMQDPLQSLALMAELHAQQQPAPAAKPPAPRPADAKRRFSLPVVVAHPGAVASATREMLRPFAEGGVAAAAVAAAAAAASVDVGRPAALESSRPAGDAAAIPSPPPPEPERLRRSHEITAGAVTAVQAALRAPLAPLAPLIPLRVPLAPPAHPPDLSAFGFKEKIYSRSPEMKVSHKLAERKRRQEINDLFVELRAALPVDDPKLAKASKWEILSRTIEYLDYYKQTQAQLVAEREHTLNRVAALLAYLRKARVAVPPELDWAPASPLSAPVAGLPPGPPEQADEPADSPALAAPGAVPPPSTPATEMCRLSDTGAPPVDSGRGSSAGASPVPSVSPQSVHMAPPAAAAV